MPCYMAKGQPQPTVAYASMTDETFLSKEQTVVPPLLSNEPTFHVQPTD